MTQLLEKVTLLTCEVFRVGLDDKRVHADYIIHISSPLARPSRYHRDQTSTTRGGLTCQCIDPMSRVIHVSIILVRC